MSFAKVWVLAKNLKPAANGRGGIGGKNVYIKGFFHKN